MIGLLLATYGAVFLAEIVGDKLLYTTGVLATHYRPVPIMAGVTAAFMMKMGVAVVIGGAISTLPRLLVAAITTTSFLAVAFVVWRKPGTTQIAAGTNDTPGKTAMISFAAILFSEWGDVGQITAATMTARFASPLVVWIGAVAAMVTKGALAASIGVGVRRWIQKHVPPSIIRYGGVSMLLVLGVLSVAETLMR